MIARACPMPARGAQRGVALFVSMILLLVLSLFAMVAANTSIMQSKMAGASRNAQLAQLAADSAISDAKARIARAAASRGASQVCVQVRCLVRDASMPAAAADLMQTPAARAAATPFRVDLGQLQDADESARLAESPASVIEDLGPVPALSGAAAPATHLFRITARGVGGNADYERVIESVLVVAE
jgi:Tfp pilus assembly protein PilX